MQKKKKTTKILPPKKPLRCQNLIRNQVVKEEKNGK